MYLRLPQRHRTRPPRRAATDAAARTANALPPPSLLSFRASLQILNVHSVHPPPSPAWASRPRRGRTGTSYNTPPLPNPSCPARAWTAATATATRPSDRHSNRWPAQTRPTELLSETVRDRFAIVPLDGAKLWRGARSEQVGYGTRAPSMDRGRKKNMSPEKSRVASSKLGTKNDASDDGFKVQDN